MNYEWIENMLNHGPLQLESWLLLLPFTFISAVSVIAHLGLSKSTVKTLLPAWTRAVYTIGIYIHYKHYSYRNHKEPKKKQVLNSKHK
jgi:hypothetical protein